jgi:hypothetical protein
MNPFRSIDSSDPLLPLPCSNLITRGSTQDWKMLFALARSSSAHRQAIRAAFRSCDPDLADCTKLWESLLVHIESGLES